MYIFKIIFTFFIQNSNKIYTNICFFKQRKKLFLIKRIYFYNINIPSVSLCFYKIPFLM